MFLYYILIAPIEMIVEWIFYLFVKINLGGVISAVIGVSVVINFLALPLYNIADALQDKERRASRKLEPRLKRIKKAFKGDEQFMMISTYYRQNNYHPLYVLRSSLSILIEIPFFIAAYHFLSNCQLLLGESFWIFKDLGNPDKIFSFKMFDFALTINILPIIMTLINVVSAAIYTRGGTVKEKIQIYVLALIFLVLLYNSPSGLVIYWILNNLFSLAKNIIQKMKNPKIILSYIVGISMLVLSVLFFVIVKQAKLSEKLLFAVLGVFFILLPTIVRFLKKQHRFESFTTKFDFVAKNSKSDLFLFSTFGLAILLGFLLPVNIINTSPVEFSFLGKTSSPFSYIYSSFFTFIGMCVFWPVCIYFMFGDKVKHFLVVLFLTLLVCALCNVYIFKPNYGNLNAMFFLAVGNRRMEVPISYYILSLLVMCFCIGVYYFCKRFHKLSIISVLIFSLSLGMVALGVYKCDFIKKEYKSYSDSKKKSDNKVTQNTISPIYHLSKKEKNVVILFLDRAVSPFLPYITQEFPSLKEQLSGFTYYPNTVSHGSCTNTGVPSMVAGYEYIPDQINARDTELLVDKHNEACLVMPKLFLDASYDVTVTDLPWLNYLLEGDLSVYDRYPQIHGYNILGKQLSQYSLEKKVDAGAGTEDVICRDKIRFFSLLQAIYPALRNRFYTVSSLDTREVPGLIYLQSFSHLYFLRDLTDFTNDKNTYTFITNNSTHDYTSLNVPNYDTVSLTEEVNYNGYEPAFKSDDISLNQTYQVNVAAFLQMAKWFDYLKANDVYDNTRIIIVADHGRDLYSNQLYPLFASSNLSTKLPSLSNPLFMVKDFNAKGELKTDNSFMSNADTLFFAIKDLPISDTNPFTGKKFEQNKKNGIIVHNDWQWNASVQKKHTTFEYDPKEGYIIKNNIFDPNNWTSFNNIEKQGD